MKCFNILAGVAAATAATVSLSYDPKYDNAGLNVLDLACSDGPNGMATKYGWQTVGQIPRFPYIGGYTNIQWNSPQCGLCYAITYNGKTINLLAIDVALDGFNMAQAAMDKLTGGQANQIGRVNADIQQVGVDQCGLTPKRDLRKIEFMA